jgi:hypothetical protein
LSPAISIANNKAISSTGSVGPRLENSIPLSRNTSDVVNVLLQRLDPGFHNVSLHHIKLKSNFATRQVVVGVGPTLPVEDIALLFDLQHPKYSSIKVCYFLTLKVEVKGFEYLILLFYSVKMYE